MLVGSRASINRNESAQCRPTIDDIFYDQDRTPFQFDYGNVQQLYFIIRHLAHAVAGDNQKIYLKRHWDGPD